MDNVTNDQVPVKNSKKRIILFFAVAAGIVLLIFFILQFNKSDTALNTSGNPDESTFYYGEYKNQPVLYYRYADMVINDLPAPRKTGHIVPLDRPYDLKDRKTYMDFKDLKNAKKIFNFGRHAGVQNYVLNGEKDILVISYVGGAVDTTNYIYQLNLKTAESKKVWEHELREGQPPYNSGIAHVMQFIPDKYAVFAIIKSNPPPKERPEGVIIVNMQTGNEKSIGAVGDVTFDLTKKVVAFKNIDKVQTNCVTNGSKKDPDCFATDTYKMIFQPVGQVITQPLP